MIYFTKMQALGNDFIVIDAVTHPVTITPELARQLADRHYGIGCDQLLVIETARASTADFFWRIFNPDGSEVSQCGNGARCVAKYIFEHALSPKTTLFLQTHHGRVETIIDPAGLVRVNLGTPIYAVEKIPFLPPHPIQNQRFSLSVPVAPFCAELPIPGSGYTPDAQTPRLSLTGKSPGFDPASQSALEFGVLSLGNPHAIILTTDLANFPVTMLGHALNHHPAFPAGVNLEIMEIIDKNKVRIRIYERGVGETFACGSGAAAATIIGRMWQMLDEKVVVSMPGGDLVVRCPKITENVWLEGGAVEVFSGNIQCDKLLFG